MRTALIAIFLGAAMASPLAAQIEDERVVRGDDGKSHGVRSEEREQRRAQRESREPEARPEPRRHEQRTDQRVGRTENGVSHRQGVARTPDRVSGTRQPEERREHRRGDRRDHRETRRDYRGDQDAHRRNPTPREHDRFHREVNRDHNRGQQRWDHNWRRDSRYDWQRHRYSNRNLYRVARYSSPYRGYRYRPISIGIRLSSGFYSHPYWINDPWRYRLPHAYAGTRWVRYYDDALLVDLFTGEVVDVIYDFFW